MINFGIIGAGFWAGYQLSAWRELKNTQCVAICDVEARKAKAFPRKFNIERVYSDPREMFAKESLDFVDVITQVESHKELVLLALKYKIPVICQKPMAENLNDCRKMVAAAEKAQVPFLIHENWRWQTPIRALKAELDRETVGRPFRASIDFRSGFPVFTNQPALARLEKFIIADLGSHLLDVARFLFGEATTLYARMQTVQKQVRGEDVATILMTMGKDTIVTCNMAYAGNYLGNESFPETMIFIEAEKGSIELTRDYWMSVTTKKGTHSRQFPPTAYPWVNPQYAVVQSSLVACNENLLAGIKGRKCETTAQDNLKTMELVYGSYESAATNKPITFSRR